MAINLAKAVFQILKETAASLAISPELDYASLDAAGGMQWHARIQTPAVCTPIRR
jgi:hypothetical protein